MAGGVSPAIAARLQLRHGVLVGGGGEDGGMDAALERFSPATREWFDGAFPQPTAAQAGAWEAISSGRHALVVAPTAQLHEATPSTNGQRHEAELPIAAPA